MSLPTPELDAAPREGTGRRAWEEEKGGEYDGNEVKEEGS